MSLHFLVKSSGRRLRRLRLPVDTRRSSDLACIDLDGTASPFDVFEAWLEEAKSCGVASPLTGNVATSTRSGRVSNRTIAFADYVDRSFVCLFSINTRKFADLYENPRASITFWWRYEDGEGRHVTRQVRTLGCAQRLRDATAQKYFAAMPLYAQVRAVLAEFPGRPIEWCKLKERHDELLRGLEEGKLELEKPRHLIASRIVPVHFDFYFGHDQFIPDRVIFRFTRDKRWLCRRVVA